VSGAWPALPYDAWKDTYATLHMWTQIVGKIALAQIPPLNHSWGVHGFWPGGDLPGGQSLREPVMYAYAVPEPAGLKEARVRPDGAYYHAGMGEFFLPYDAVRTASSPERAIREFVDSTYDAAATLARWDRKALERA
jgi:hypothetical protein